MTAYAVALREQPTLTTERLHLRQPAGIDIPAIIRIAGDWAVASQLTRMPHPYTPSDARFFLDSVVATELTWMIVERAMGSSIGVIGLSPRALDPDSVWIGYYLDPVAWGRGFATEAGTSAVAFAFNTLGCRHITSGYFADNPASGRVLAKLGFVSTGIVEHACLASRSSKPLIEMLLEQR